MALTDTAGGTQTDPGTGKPSENPPADPNKPTPPKEETTSALTQFERIVPVNSH